MKKSHKSAKHIDAFGHPKSSDFNFDLIERYYHKKDHSSNLQTLSDKTCNDLDFQELFMMFDRTISKPGQQYLYDKLRSIPANNDAVLHNEKIIERFLTDADFRSTTQKLLEKLNREEAYYISTLFQDEHTKPPKWFFIVPILSFTSLLSLVMLIFSSSYIILFLGVFIANLILHYWNKRNLYPYLSSLPQLLRLNNAAAKLFQEECFREIDPQLPDSVKIINQVRNRMSFFQLDEIFKGTNTVERISAGKAVLSALAQNNHTVFVSTHDIELADMLSDQYALYHFSEIIDHKNIDFDYKLKAGKLKNRNAIRILQINDYPAGIINEAMEIAKQLDIINENTRSIKNK